MKVKDLDGINEMLSPHLSLQQARTFDVFVEDRLSGADLDIDELAVDVDRGCVVLVVNTEAALRESKKWTAAAELTDAIAEDVIAEADEKIRQRDLDDQLAGLNTMRAAAKEAGFDA